MADEIVLAVRRRVFRASANAQRAQIGTGIIERNVIAVLGRCGLDVLPDDWTAVGIDDSAPHDAVPGVLLGFRRGLVSHSGILSSEPFVWSYPCGSTAGRRQGCT